MKLIRPLASTLLFGVGIVLALYGIFALTFNERGGSTYVTLAGHREMVARDSDQRVARHFVILCFASRWIAGEPKLNEELSDFRWLKLEDLAGLKTTDGLAEIVATAFERIAAAG